MNKALSLKPETVVGPTPFKRFARLPLSRTFKYLSLTFFAAFLVCAWGIYYNEFSLQSRAERGEAAAQYLLGKAYFDTALSPADYGRSARLVRKAANQGYAKAQAAMGLLYERGLGVSKDYSQALVWFRRAAQQGEPVAQNELGVMYAKSRGVPRDMNQAAKWFRLAAAQGSEVAKRNLELAAVANASPIGQLVTSEHRSYRGVVLQKVEPDGITISFRPQSGGFGLAKLRMENLPSDLQDLCRYSAQERPVPNTAFSPLGSISRTL